MGIIFNGFVPRVHKLLLALALNYQLLLDKNQFEVVLPDEIFRFLYNSRKNSIKSCRFPVDMVFILNFQEIILKFLPVDLNSPF